jgi:hypothetical protein
MTLRGAIMLSWAGGLALAGCGGGGGAAATCSAGLHCDGDGGGGDSGGDDVSSTATCGNVQPCGGDVVGDWTFVDACESAANVAAFRATFATMAAESWCPGQTLVDRKPSASGSLLFDAAGTYSLALTFGGYLDINLPAVCLAGVSCEDTTAGLQAQIDAGAYPMPNVSSISCSGTSSCLCRATIDSPRSDSGTYSVSGNVLTLTATSGIVTDKSHCVRAGTLHILDTSMGSAGQTTIDSDLVAMKR